MSAIQNNQRRFHIILDAFGCDTKLISDTEKIREIIRAVARLCGMSIMHGPVVLKGVPENPGVTGFAIIDFSHISIHTFTNAREACVDIFSCKPFNYEKVRLYIIGELGLKPENVRYIEVAYPSNVTS